jgi:hypothetical protein
LHCFRSSVVFLVSDIIVDNLSGVQAWDLRETLEGHIAWSYTLGLIWN